MKNIYTMWAVILAICLELGIFYLFYFDLIGNATAISVSFAVGSVAVAAVMLRDTAFDYQDDRGRESQD